MNGTSATDHSPYATAQRALSRRDPKLRPIIKRVGPCTLKPHSDLFAVLVRTIISQQLSTKAALTIANRLQALLPNGLEPVGLDRLDDGQIRTCGISGGKLKSIRDLCGHVRKGTVHVDRLATLTDEQVREVLLQVHGIGPWSVDMYLIFCLGRLDVLPVGDLGLRLGVKAVYGLRQAPSPPQLVKIAEPWRPYRSVATWYMWRSRGFVPQS